MIQDKINALVPDKEHGTTWHLRKAIEAGVAFSLSVPAWITDQVREENRENAHKAVKACEAELKKAQKTLAALEL